jgi:hypothetical protein
MRNNHYLKTTLTVCGALCALTFLAGCQSTGSSSTSTAAKPAEPAGTPPATASTAKPATPATPATAAKVIRINAGAFEPFTDSSGNVWAAETGFDGGSTIDRDPSLAIQKTKDPTLFHSEHYSMDSFSVAVPNGKYLAKLYFAETFDGISGPGERVFSFSLHGHDFKDFDVWVKAGGANIAYVESVPVEVTDGKFMIKFTPNVENPEINAIELIPQP